MRSTARCSRLECSASGSGNRTTSSSGSAGSWTIRTRTTSTSTPSTARGPRASVRRGSTTPSTRSSRRGVTHATPRSAWRTTRRPRRSCSRTAVTSRWRGRSATRPPSRTSAGSRGTAKASTSSRPTSTWTCCRTSTWSRRPERRPGRGRLASGRRRVRGQPANEIRQALVVVVGQIEEVEDVAVGVDPEQDRGRLDALILVRRRERELDGGAGAGDPDGADLHGRDAHVDARRLPLGAVTLTDTHGQRDARAGGPAPLRSRLRSLEPLEEAVKLLEGYGLREELDGAHRQAFLGLALRRDP